jgi:hypothetical protein
MNRFFVNYFIGARGDFLMRCLYDIEYDWHLIHNLTDNAKISPPVEYSAKIHGEIDSEIITAIENFPKLFYSWKELFDAVNSYNLIKIKIVANTIEEQIDLAWLAYSKVILNNTRVNMTPAEIPLPTTEIINEGLDWLIANAFTKIPLVQSLDSEFQHEYDYIVKFDDLFNAEYIRDLYKKINGRNMDYARFKAIKKNIAMQYRFSKSEFYPILKQRYNEIVIN